MTPSSFDRKAPLLRNGGHRALATFSFAVALASATAALAAGTSAVRWICTTETQRWQEKAVEPIGPNAPTANDVIVLDPTKQFQTIDGFGGCFNEPGWEALTSIPADRREAALKELISPDGANFPLGRVPIGANDFSLGWYSLNETPGDYEMKDFSVARTHEDLIPFIRAAMKYQPKLGIWATPWCPPSWMTTNGRYRPGSMKRDPQTLAAYALYFSKFVQSWRAEGIHLYAIHLRRRPAPQCHPSRGQTRERRLL